MVEELTLYECNAAHCTLGTVGNPGHFTGGMTAEAKNMLTGSPVENLEEGTDYGEGICPNCGTPGEEAGTHQSVEGDDPHQDLHYSILARVSDENDSLQKWQAQDAFLKAVSDNG